MAFVSARVASLLLALTAACSTQAARPASAPTRRVSAEPRTFVWVTGGDRGTPKSYALSASGEVTAEMNGVHILAAGTEWAVAVSTETVATRPCSGGPEQPAGEGRGVRLRLVPADPHHSALDLVTPTATEDANQVEQSVRLLASIGPYVFVEGETYAYTCGAHGNTGVSFVVWDVVERRAVDFVSDLPDREHLLAQGKAAIDAEPDAFDFSRAEDPVTITELVPHFDAAGRLGAVALVTAPTCYACTRGGWSSYTASVEVTTQLPWRLRAVGAPPHEVTLFAAEHPDLTVGGYSVSDRREERETR